MKKGSEQKMVHPGNVGNHIRFGWMSVEQAQAEPVIVDEESHAEPEAEGDSEAPEEAEEIAGVEDETDAEPETVEEFEDESTTESGREALTPKARISRKKKK
jgi:hypothetical protein